MSKRITDYLTDEQICIQLAEEAAELSAAAAKMARKLGGVNPTPKSEKECWDNLLEEMADVNVCIEELLDYVDLMGMRRTITRKRERWHERLEEANPKGFRSKSVTREGYIVKQAPNGHVMVIKSGRMVMHSPCDTEKTETELLEMIDIYEGLCKLCKET